MQKIIVAGASAAGLSAARELRRRGFTGALTLVDREEGRPYRRPEVSKGVLQGLLSREDVGVPWPDDLDLFHRDATEIDSLDTHARELTVSTASGSERLPFDGLVVATGATARPSPFPVARGVHTLRTFADSRRMQAELAIARRVVIVGGGFIGLEVAAVCHALGTPAIVVEAAAAPLASVLGKELSAHMVRLHTDRGVRIDAEATVAEVHAGPDGAVRAVTLAGGTTLQTDLLLVAIGSRPEVGWLADTGLDVVQGVRCDHTLAVEGLQNVVAAGDVAAWTNPRYDRRMRVEHWTNAVDQGMYAARRLLGVHDEAGFSSAPYFWSDQFGMRLQSVGSTLDHDEAVVVEQDGDRMLVVYGRQGTVQAVAGIATGAAVIRLRPLVEAGVDMDTARARAGELLLPRR